MKAFFPETCPKYPRSVMRTGDGIPAGRVADGQEHEARRPHAAGGERGEHGGEQGETRGPWAGARRPRPPFPARVQEHGGDEPAQQDSRGRPEQDGESGSCLPYASVRNAYGRHAAGDARPRTRKERKPS